VKAIGKARKPKPVTWADVMEKTAAAEAAQGKPSFNAKMATAEKAFADFKARTRAMKRLKALVPLTRKRWP
jgi:hypothetical protein